MTSTSAPDLDTLGVSVYWLKHGFLPEVLEAGLSDRSTIYDLEDLRSETLGVIRRKGKDVICPIDHRPGASYVHSLLQPRDNDDTEVSDRVGTATVMLSYGWGYAIGDIVDTLWDYCVRNNLPPKGTFCWMCCLCVNQHRVAENWKMGKETLYQDFRDLFFRRVTGIGHVLAMLSPWDAPLYLTRVWCIYELFIASESIHDEKDSDKINTRGSQPTVTIVMPPRDKQDMAHAIGSGGLTGIHRLYESLAKTNAENAKASHEKDKENIFQLVRDGPGFRVLNVRVNQWLRQWVKLVILERIQELELKQLDEEHNLDNDESAQSFINFLSNVGKLFFYNGESNVALECYQKALAMQQYHLGPDHLDVSTTYHDIGTVLNSRGDYEDSLENHYKALDIRERTFGKDHQKTATSYKQVGFVLHNKGDLEEALKYHRKSLAIRESAWQNHPNTASCYHHVGDVLCSMRDYDGALEHHRKALEIRKIVHRKHLPHLNIARSHRSIGHVMETMQSYDTALAEYHKCLEIQTVVLDGDFNVNAATSYECIGTVLFQVGDCEGAKKQHYKCLEIRESILGCNHLDTATSYYNIGTVLKQQGANLGNGSSAMEFFYKCHATRESILGRDHPNTKMVLAHMEND